MKSDFSAQDILDIIRAFFAAILNVLKALGINFGDTEPAPEEPKPTPTEATPTNATPTNG